MKPNIDLPATKLPKVGTTIFTIVGNMAREHGAIDVSQGFPNFDADPELMELAYDAMQQGHNQYAPMAGYFGLREMIAEKTLALHGREYHPETEITVTVGATEAIFTAITAFVRPGDEVIVIKPAYDCYEPAIEVNGGRPVFLQLQAPEFGIDWQRFRDLITPKTRMAIINTPHNPSGRILSEGDIVQLQEALRHTNVIVVSDEVYEHIVFDGALHQSLCRFDDLAGRSFICSSFGKTFHVTGWKVGYCCAPADLMREFRKTHQFNVFSVDHPAQRALALYLRDASHYTGLNAFYQRKRDLFLSGITRHDLHFTKSEGTYFQLIDYSEISDLGDVEMAKKLIVEHKLACIPISVFNVAQEDPKLLRFCFAKKDETLEMAAAILNSL